MRFNVAGLIEAVLRSGSCTAAKSSFLLNMTKE